MDHAGLRPRRGLRRRFLTREHAPAFLEAHDGLAVFLHSAPFDLAVLHALEPGLDVYGLVERGLVIDTQLRHRLLCLATEGQTAGGRGESTLEHCAEIYLGIELPKDVVDSRGRPVRTSYGVWLGRDPGEIEPVYLEYLALDAAATHAVAVELEPRLAAAHRGGRRAWGYVDGGWLAEQARLWGPATHDIQLRAAVVLREVTANGLRIEEAHRDAVLAEVRAEAAALRATLRAHGFVPGQAGQAHALNAILLRIEDRTPGLALARTRTGKVSTSREALAPLAASEPFVRDLLAFKALEKLESSFLGKLAGAVVRPSFDVLKTTGRTSSFGQLNAQNLPRDGRVRRCLVPRPGHLFYKGDYKAIELATLAQSLRTQFGLDSRLGDALNAGLDPHAMVAALATGKAQSEVTSEERRKAKTINFGKPGAMGDEALKDYARDEFGVELTDAEVAALSAAWFGLFPEMRTFLAPETDPREDAARFLGLTRAGHGEHTGSRRFAGHPSSAGLEGRPSPALGGMCLKALGTASPTTSDGRPYDGETLDYFWARLEARAEDLPREVRGDALARRPSRRLRRAVQKEAGRAPVFTATGRLRAAASFAARHNNLFQGVAADGAKLALWDVWRAGYRIVNFVHDELVVELPEGPDAAAHARRIAALMVAAMRRVVPDVRVAVEYVLARSYDAGRDGVGKPEVVASDDDSAVLAVTASGVRVGIEDLAAI